MTEAWASRPSTGSGISRGVAASDEDEDGGDGSGGRKTHNTLVSSIKSIGSLDRISMRAVERRQFGEGVLCLTEISWTWSPWKKAMRRSRWSKEDFFPEPSFASWGAYHGALAIVLSYVVADVSAMLSVLCYAEFAVEIPVAGGSFAYLRVELGEIAAFVAAANLVLESCTAPGDTCWHAHMGQGSARSRCTHRRAEA